MRQGTEHILPHKPTATRWPLPCLLFPSSFYGFGSGPKLHRYNLSTFLTWLVRVRQWKLILSLPIIHNSRVSCLWAWKTRDFPVLNSVNRPRLQMKHSYIVHIVQYSTYIGTIDQSKLKTIFTFYVFWVYSSYLKVMIWEFWTARIKSEKIGVSCFLTYIKLLHLLKTVIY